MTESRTLATDSKNREGSLLRKGGLLSKVPEVTFYFWVIKVLCTTVGETAADFLNVNLNFGLTGTSIVTGILLLAALTFQFRSKKYVPVIYWMTVMIISVFGTLVTDNLTDRLNVPLQLSTLVFGGLLGVTFLAWYLREGTLSIHSIFTARREGFYWLAILFTFALGTAAGDLMAEGLALGYSTTGLIIAVLIAMFATGWRLGLNHVLAFWIIYILTRPLGASLGDYLSQPHQYGGLGLGATVTSELFVGGILVLVTYLSVSKKDTIGNEYLAEIKQDERPGALLQTAIVLLVLVISGGFGYRMRHSELESRISQSRQTAQGSDSAEAASVSDWAPFSQIAQDTLVILEAGHQSGATKRIGDLEYEWDHAEAVLKPKDPVQWTKIDKQIDVVLRRLRSTSPVMTDEKNELKTLLAMLK